VPAERMAVLRRAFAALESDKDFLADAEKGKLEVNLIGGAAVEKFIELITRASPEVRARYNQATK
jgi:hypothetical protein